MLSLVVPVYNVEQFLEECLSSLQNQTSDNFEVIIVNDGSTDGCEKIIKEYCAKNKNFYYYYKDNGGLMSAYLLGIEKSKGDYIGFVDSDDYVDKNFAKLMYEENFENADIVICERHDFPQTKKNITSTQPIIPFGFYEGYKSELIYQYILPKFYGEHISNARWNKIFKRDIVISNLKYLESKSRIMEDRFFTPSCMFTAKSFKFIKDKLYYYRQRKTGSNHSMPSPNLYNSIKLLMNTQRQMLQDKGLFQKYECNYEQACLNYLSLFIDRNLLSKQTFINRMKFSEQILNDKDFQIAIKRHKKDLKHKKGFMVRISFFFKSKFLMSFLSTLGRLK